jgi:transglutaminase-like putative cysteine protease
MNRMPPSAMTRPAGMALLLTAALSLLPFLPELPWLIATLAVLLLLWQGWLTKQDAAAPARSVMILLAILGASLCLAEYRTLFGREAGLTMLALFLPLKLLESRSQRDARATLLLCCFMMTGQFLNAQNLGVAATVLLCAVAILATSARLERPDLALRPALGSAGKLLAGALPLMVLLFVLFPRIDGPLWRLPGDAQASTSGLSDTMQPGSIAELILSGEIAFRAEFEGALPPPRERYWRGPVLTDFDGRVWRERFAGAFAAPRYETRGPAYRYTLTLEPHNRPWLLALDFPGPGISRARYGSALNLLSTQPVSNRLRLDLTAYPASQVGLDESDGRLRAALNLPVGRNPRTVAAGRELETRFPDPRARLAAAIALLRDAKLTYTLNPPLLGNDPADEFLFDSKRGFCEHFASSFVVLARAAGLPSRVVTGYQGGERNPVDGTLVVRQSDAHAWAEVWFADAGWQRVDPTATSAPARIDDGISGALQNGESLPMMFGDSRLLRELRHRWEAMSNGWNQWVLGYNASRQNELMRRLGLPDADWRTLATALASTAGLWIGYLLIRLWPRRKRQDALDTIWRSFCRKLARHGLRREPWEPAEQFARRAALALPRCADTIHGIAEHYARLRFGRTPPSTHELRQLRQSVKQLKP